jgi:hypothetical protein
VGEGEGLSGILSRGIVGDLRLPLSVLVSVFLGGNKIVPTDVTPTRLENRVVVVVKTLAVDTLVTAEETTVATVSKELVRRALVIVVTGKGSEFAGTENTETWPPETVEPLESVALKGFVPPRMLMGPDSARRAVGLLTWVHWIRALFLLSV